MRSGNQFLVHTIAKNFFPHMIQEVRGKQLGHWDNRYYAPPFITARTLLGTHSLGEHGPKALCPRGIHIYRDGRSVITSLFRNKHTQPKSWEGYSFSTYIRALMDWELAPIRKAKPVENIIQHWYRFEESWKDINIYHVRFEDLIVKPIETLKAIQEEFGLRLRADELHISKGLVGIEPNEGKIDTWKQYFSEEDLEYFHTIVPKNFWALYGTE